MTKVTELNELTSVPSSYLMQVIDPTGFINSKMTVANISAAIHLAVNTEEGAEINDAISVGSGASLLTGSKQGSQVEIKSLVAGANVSLTPTATAVEIAASAGAGGGDVTGPDGGVQNTEIAAFDGTTGKILEGTGVLVANLGTGDVVGPASAVDSNFAAFDTTTGKLIKDSGSAAADFATAAHNHDGVYSPVGHDHNADYAPIAHVGAGGAAHANAIAAGAAGFMTGADKTILDTINADYATDTDLTAHTGNTGDPHGTLPQMINQPHNTDANTENAIQFAVCTQAEYDGYTPDAGTVYFIAG